MSYPPVPIYYCSTARTSNQQRQHGAIGHHTALSQLYQSQRSAPEDGRQTQSSPQNLSGGWTGQSQITVVNHMHNSYTSDTWNNRTNTSSPYGYQRETSISIDQGNASGQTHQSHDPYNSQNTQGLNHLAYAFALDTSTSSSTDTQRSRSQPSSSYPSSTATESQAVVPPVASFGVPFTSSTTYRNQPTASYPARHDVKSPEDSSALAMNAFAAIAGAVRTQYQHQQPASTAIHYKRISTSPQTRNTQAHQSSGIHSSNPPSDIIQIASEQTHGQPNQPRLSIKPPFRSGKPLATKAATKAINSEPRDPPQSIAKSFTAQSPQPQSQPQSQPPQTTHILPVSSNPQSNANLMSSTTEPEMAFNDLEDREPMPNFIDPTQVFNPYHREHERKKREAAEAEARREAERKVAEETRRANEEAVKRASESSAVANSKLMITKKSGTAAAELYDGQFRDHAADSSSNAPAKNGMATEMQTLMAKLKDLRSADPAMFQKIWNDMRGGTMSAQVPNPVMANATAVIQSPTPEVAVPPPRSTSTAKPMPEIKNSEPTPTPNGVPLNGLRAVVDDNEDGLPDLGRFPAGRRIRHAFGKHKGDEHVQVLESPKPFLVNTPEAQNTSASIQNRPQDSSTALPEPRRRAVAVTAIHLPKSNPDNVSNKITAQEICSIRGLTPSYMDLRKELEQRGLEFQRPSFTRELLKNVPDLHTPSSKSNASGNQVSATISEVAQHMLAPDSVAQIPASQTTTPHIATPQPQVSQPQPSTAHPQHMTQGSTNMHVSSQNGLSHAHSSPGGPPGGFTGLSPVKYEQGNSSTKQLQKPLKQRPSVPGRPEPPPGSKEAAARKRDFSEIVDLTATIDDENYVLPVKRLRVEPAQPIDPLKKLQNGMLAGFNSKQSQPLRFNSQPQLPMDAVRALLQPPPGYTTPTFQPGTGTHHFPPAQSTSNKARMILAKKIDRSEALQKSYYSPKTIARDVLIASGRHPSERPLNIHLSGMIGSYIDIDSDVSTFDWDIIDPGGPPPGRVAYVDIQAAPPRFKLGERVRKRNRMREIDNEDKPAMPEAERRRSRVGSTTPAPAPAGSRLNSPASIRSSPQPCASSKKSRPSLQQKLAHRRARGKNEDKPEEDDSKVTSNVRKIIVDIPTSLSPKHPNRSSNSTPPKKITMDNQHFPSGKRRGRPPGSKNKYPSIAAMKQQAKVVVAATTQEVQEEVAAPVLHSYKCKWVKCHAELHNIDTLKRHVAKVHKPEQVITDTNDLACWWKNCPYLVRDDDGSIVPIHTFENREEWMGHIDENHIQPIAIKYGDGPKSSQTDSQSVNQAREQYLSNADGRVTTPLVSLNGNTEHPPDAMVLMKTYANGTKLTDREKADVTAHNAFMKAHGNKHKDIRKAAEEVVRAMEVRKKKIGPGIDRGGCTLINEERRNTFVQAPGISRIVDYEY